MARAKQDAIDAEANERSEGTYRQALREERRAMNLRPGRDEAAAQAFQVAAERFKKAATEARLSAEDEEQERLKKPPNEPERGQTPPPTPAPQKPPLNTDAEKQVVIQLLRRYELAYASLSVAAVKSMHPGAATEQLTRQFADSRSYTLSIKVDDVKFLTELSADRTRGFVSAHLVYDVVTKAGQRKHDERSGTIVLEKQRGTWLITDVP